MADPRMAGGLLRKIFGHDDPAPAVEGQRRIDALAQRFVDDAGLDGLSAPYLEALLELAREELARRLMAANFGLDHESALRTAWIWLQGRVGAER